MINPYIPMSTDLNFGDLYEFVKRVTAQADFNHYFEAIAELAQRRNPIATERECKRIAYENLHRAMDSTLANPEAHQWLEALRPDGYVAFIERPE